MSVNNPPILEEQISDNKEVPSGVIDNANKIFTTVDDIANGSQLVYLNGQLLEANEDYSVTDSNQITMADALRNTRGNVDKLFIVYTPS